MYALVIFPRKLVRLKIFAITKRNHLFQIATIVTDIRTQRIVEYFSSKAANHVAYCNMPIFGKYIILFNISYLA